MDASPNLTPRKPHAELLHCTHDFLTSGCSLEMGGCVHCSLLATGLLPPRWRNQARDVHRTAERYCVLHFLLRALQPQPSLLDCVGDEFLSIQARARTHQPRGNSWHESTEIENPNKKEDEGLQTSCKVRQIGYRSSGTDW